MNRRDCAGLVMVVLFLTSGGLISCPEDDEQDCAQIVTGDWDFTVIETWDCDTIAETDPEVHGLIVSQLDCEVSFTGTFRNGLGGIMTGSINKTDIFIEFYDQDDGCTLTLEATLSGDRKYMSGTWIDDCYDPAEDCAGEAGTFSAAKV